jgi:hypothetical protein
MKMNFTPYRAPAPMTVSVAGDVITVNGEAFDLSAIPEGATLPREAVDCDWLASDIERQDGQLRLTLRLPHGPDAPEATRFPQPITITADGPVALPPFAEEPET